MFLSTSCLTPCFPSAPQFFPLPSSFFSFFLYDFISLTTLHSDPSGRFLQHFNRALKITIFSFIHTGFAIMQPLCAGRLEVNPLSHHYPYKLLSDSSAPKTETNLTSLSLIYNLFTALVFPHFSFKGRNRHKKSKCLKCYPRRSVLSFVAPQYTYINILYLALSEVKIRW